MIIDLKQLNYSFQIYDAFFHTIGPFPQGQSLEMIKLGYPYVYSLGCPELLIMADQLVPETRKNNLEEVDVNIIMSFFQNFHPTNVRITLSIKVIENPNTILDVNVENDIFYVYAGLKTHSTLNLNDIRGSDLSFKATGKDQ